MMNNPFEYRESAIERFIREERERADLYKHALGGGAVAEAIRQATATDTLMRAGDFDAPYRGILDTLRRERETEAAYKSLTSNAWALSVTETARTLAAQNGALVEQQRHLASSVLDTVRAFDANKSLVASAIAAASVGDTYRKMVAEALPRFATFGAIAERMLMIDTMTARLSDDVAETATAFAARTVIEMQRVAEAIADAETDAESSELQESMLDLIMGLFSNLGPNTIPQLQRMGLVEFAGYICTFLSLVLSAYALIPHEQTMGPQEKAAFAEVSAKLDQSLAENHRYHEAAARSDEAFLSRLPRAALARAATLRSTPARDGEIVLKAPKGTELAIERAQGNWRKIVFRDPLSNQLARGWVYASVLTPLAAVPADDGE